MNWFYAEHGQKHGPISDGELISLAEKGSLRAETLIWREGMPNWEKLGSVRPDLVSSPGAARFGGVELSEQSKNLLVQRMREGVLADAGGTGVRYVGFWWRFLAFIIDAIIFWVVQQMVLVTASMAGMRVTFVYQPSGPGTSLSMEMVDWTIQAILLVMQAVYYTWTTARFGGTPGKLALGFKVVTATGSSVGWGRSFGRWAAGSVLNFVILSFIILVPVGLVFFLGMGGLQGLKNLESGTMPGIWALGMLVAMMVGTLAGSFPWWMAALDSQKRALHDRICATRVVWK